MNKKPIYLTGATGGIGTEVTKLLESDYHVLPIVSRLEDLDQLEIEVRSLIKTNPPYGVIHCGGFGLFKPHEELNPKQIASLIHVNLTGPAVINSLVLRSIKEQQGCIIHVTSVEATKPGKWTAVYSASKAGLRMLSHCLAEEARKSGVRVCSINPGITRTRFFRKLGFKPMDGLEYALEPTDLALVIKQILEFPGIVQDMTVIPKKVGIEKQLQNQTII
jgi:short-subunit dehydrogenase